MSATKEEIGARVDGLAQEHEGAAFVEAVRGLADDLGPEALPLLQEVLLERAAEEEDFRKAVGRRFAEKGWTARTLARLERVWRDDRAAALVAALEAGAAGREALEQETARLRPQPGRAALVLDQLSRHASPLVRRWVPGAAAELLGGSGVSVRLILALTRDRDAGVRTAAAAAILDLDPEAARRMAPDQRRRLQSPDARDRVAAGWILAELRDARSLGVLAERGERAEDEAERAAAQAAALTIRGDEQAIVAGLCECDPIRGPAFATAARILGSDATVAALRACAESAPAEACRDACRAELERIPTEEE